MSMLRNLTFVLITLLFSIPALAQDAIPMRVWNVTMPVDGLFETIYTEAEQAEDFELITYEAYEIESLGPDGSIHMYLATFINHAEGGMVDMVEVFVDYGGYYTSVYQSDLLPSGIVEFATDIPTRTVAVRLENDEIVVGSYDFNPEILEYED